MCADERWSHLEGQQTCADGHRRCAPLPPCGHQLSPVEHNLALISAWIADGDLVVFCGIMKGLAENLRGFRQGLKETGYIEAFFLQQEK